LKDFTNIQTFLNSVLKKLSNDRFVSSAPEAVVALEKAKQADAEAKIKVLEERIEGLRKKEVVLVVGLSWLSWLKRALSGFLSAKRLF
jgi:low affinity Fe/Cu permease